MGSNKAENNEIKELPEKFKAAISKTQHISDGLLASRHDSTNRTHHFIVTADSDEKAVFHYMSAAELGDPVAQAILGNAFSFEKFGLKRSYEKAYYYYSLAAKQDYVPGILGLYFAYNFGRGVAISQEKQFLYAKMAADKNDPDGLFFLANHYRYATGDEHSLFQAKRLYEKAAMLGSLSSQYILALGYFHGEMGLPICYEQAFFYYKMAADQNDAISMLSVAKCYEEGLGVERSLEQAYHCYKRIIEKGEFCHEWVKLCHCYEKGVGTQRSLLEAFNVCKQAADAGIPEAQYSIGYCYEKGICTNKSLESSFLYYKLAADQGIPDAQRRVAFHYKGGLGVEQSNEKAHFYQQLFDKQSEESAPWVLPVLLCSKFGLPKK